MVHPAHRRRGIATELLGVVVGQARRSGARRLYLTSEPDNTAADATWRRLGFANPPGDTTVGTVQIISDVKGLATTVRCTTWTCPLPPRRRGDGPETQVTS